jgi:KDO2-lipid IV(A) lauroyltransferase
MQEKILFALFKIFSNIIKMTPTIKKINFIKALSNQYLKLKLSNKRKKVMLKNLEYAFPENNKKENNKIAIASLNNLGMNVIQCLNNYNNQTLKDLNINVEQEYIITDAIKNNKKIIFVTAHFGNWELLTSLIALKYTKMLAIYKSLKHKLFDKYLLISRENSGLVMKEKHGGIKPLIKSLKDGNSIGLLIDQGTTLEGGVEVSFFDKPTYFISSASQLSRMTGAVIIPIFIYTDNYIDYTLKVYPEIECEKTKDKIKDIKECTQKQANVFEKAIRLAPNLWFWSHKRWRHTNPDLYKT